MVGKAELYKTLTTMLEAFEHKDIHKIENLNSIFDDDSLLLDTDALIGHISFMTTTEHQ